MLNRSYPGYVVIGLAVFSCVGWGLFLKKSQVSHNGPGPDSSTASRRGGERQERAPSIASMIHNPRSARLFADLGNVANTAPDGAVNEKLIKLCRNTLDDTDAESRKRDFAMLMEQLRPEDAAAMHEAFLSMHENGKGFAQEYACFATRWGEVDGAGAMKYLFSRNPPVVPDGDFQNITIGWSQTDPQGAVAWMAAHQDEALQLGGRPAIMAGWTRLDPAAATAWLVSQNLNPGEMGRCVASAMEEQFHAVGAAETVRWLAELPDEGQLGGAASRSWDRAWGALRELPYEKAAAVWNDVADQPWMTIGQFDRFANTVASTRKADRGLEGFFDELSKQWPAEQISSRFQQWAQDDPATTAQWLDNAPPSPVRTAAIQGMIQTFQTSDPDTAEAWRKKLAN